MSRSLPFLLLLVAAWGCSDAPQEEGRVLARIGDRVITEEMFAKRVKGAGSSTATRAETKAGRAAILDSMIKHELLLAECERRNMRADAEVRDAVNPLLARRFLDKEFEPTVRIEDVPEEDVRAIYDERIREFKQPETWRFGVIQVANKAKAAELMKRLANANNDDDVFEAIATTEDNLDAELRRSEGNIGYLPMEDLRRAIPEDLRPTFERLKETDEKPEVVETPRGLFMVMMTGHRPPLERTYESVSSGLRQQAFRNYRERKLEAFAKTLRPSHQVTANYELLSLVRVLPPERRAPPYKAGTQEPTPVEGAPAGEQAAEKAN